VPGHRHEKMLVHINLHARCTTALSALHKLPGLIVCPDLLIGSTWICSTEKISYSSNDGMEIEVSPKKQYVIISTIS
jgi:hypothetical protein